MQINLGYKVVQFLYSINIVQPKNAIKHKLQLLDFPKINIIKDTVNQMHPNSLNSTFSSNCLHPLELNSYPSSKISNQGCWGRGSLFIFLFLIPLQHFASSFCERGQTFYFHLLLARKWHSWVARGPGESILSVFPDFQ